MLIVDVAVLDGGVARLYGVVALLDGHAELLGSCCEDMLGWPRVVPNAVLWH
jgi:hypothetical protein